MLLVVLLIPIKVFKFYKAFAVDIARCVLDLNVANDYATVLEHCDVEQNDHL